MNVSEVRNLRQMTTQCLQFQQFSQVKNSLQVSKIKADGSSIKISEDTVNEE